MLRLTREKNRKCDACPFVGEVFFVAYGGKSFRACNACLCTAERLRVRLHTEGLESVEQYR